MSAKKVDESCSSVDVSGPTFKSKAHNDQNHVSSCHGSSLVIPESRAMFGALASTWASKNSKTTQRSFTDAPDEDRSGRPSVSRRNIKHRKSLDPTKDKHKLDDHGTGILCNSELKDVHEANSHNVETDKKDARGSSASSDALLVTDAEKATANEHDDEDKEEEHLKKNRTTSTPTKKARIQDVSVNGQPPLKYNTSAVACVVNRTDCSYTDDSWDFERVDSPGLPKDKKDKQLTGELATSSVDQKNFTLLPNCMDTASNDVSTASASIKETSVCLQVETGTESKFSIETVKTSNMCEQSTELDSSNPASNIELLQENREPLPGGEVSEEIVDDVKICDICGDAGQEENLALCSRCSDGAEHIYCMRLRLFKVPEGDWVCEECQMKEDSENQNAGRSVGESPMMEEECLNDMPSIETKETDPDVRSSIKKTLRTETSSKQSLENPEAALKPDKRKSEASDGSTGMMISGNPILLSLENSFNKTDMVKAKASLLSTVSGQSEKLSHAPLDKNAAKVQTGTESIKGSLSKSFSFNSSKVPKVKQLTEVIPQKQKFTREPTSRGIRKEGPMRMLTNSASFNNVNSGSFNVAKKVELLLKERSAVDEKISIFSDRPSDSPSSVSATKISSIKVDEKPTQVDGKVKKIPVSTNSNVRRGSNAASSLEKKHLPQVRSSRSPSLFKSEEQNASPLAPKSSNPTHRDDKRKESSFLNSSKSAVSSGNRVLWCRRCNETGHSTQLCAVDRLCMPPLKPSSEWNEREGGNKSCKQKHEVEVANSKVTKKKTGGSLDKSEEVSTSSADVNPEVTSKVTGSTSLSSKILPLLKGSVDGKLFRSSSADTKDYATINEKQKTANQKKTVLVHKKSDLNTMHKIPDWSSMKTDSHNLHDQAMMLAYDATVIPQSDFVWQGAFEVLRVGKLPTVYDGFQAHFSSFVSPKAVEVAEKFPYRIQLEEVSRKSSWPLHFHETSPKEDDIALFFFAKDKESYDKCYANQLDNMVKNDLALRGSIDAVELLIFPSILLPEGTQRWNNLYFLWALFKVEETKFLENRPACEENSLVANSSKELVEQDLSNTITSGLSICQDANNKNLQNDLPRCEISSMTRGSNSTSYMELHDVLGTENKICKAEGTLAAKDFPQEVAGDKMLLEQPSSLFPANCSSTGMNQLPSILASCPERKILIDIEQLPPEEEDDYSYLNEPEYKSVKRGETGQLHEDHAATMFTSRSTNPFYSVSLGHRQETGSKRSEMRSMQEDDSFGETKTALGSIQSQSVLETDPNVLGSTPRKRHSCPTEITGHIFSYETDKEFPFEEASGIMITNGTEQKRMKFDNGGHVSYVSNDIPASEFSSIICPLTRRVVEDKIYPDKVSTDSRVDEKFLFSVEEGPTTSTKAEDLVYVISSDDDEPSGRNAPDLTLALGTQKSSRDKLSASVHAGDGDPALLSLSLAFPASEKAPAAKTTKQKEQLLPNKSSINKPLFLFEDLNETCIE